MDDERSPWSEPIDVDLGRVTPLPARARGRRALRPARTSNTARLTALLRPLGSTRARSAGLVAVCVALLVAGYAIVRLTGPSPAEAQLALQPPDASPTVSGSAGPAVDPATALSALGASGVPTGAAATGAAGGVLGSGVSTGAGGTSAATAGATGAGSGATGAAGGGSGNGSGNGSGAGSGTGSGAGSNGGSGSGAGTGTPAKTGAGKIAGGRLGVGVSFADILPDRSASAKAKAMDDLLDLHAGWLRMDLPWRGVQPFGPSSFVWDRFDPVVKLARSKGLNVLMILGQAPDWARDSSCSSQLFCPPASNAQYAAFAAEAAKHYGAMGVNTFEVWNEPNMTTFWINPDAARYGRLLLAAADAVHEAAPNARVLVGGLAAADGVLPIQDQVKFLTTICSTGACAKIDGVGYHPYTYPLRASDKPGWATPWTRMSAMRSVLVDAGRSDVPFWVTEFGAPTQGPGRISNGGPDPEGGHTDHVTEAVQADLAADVLPTAEKDPNIAAVFWHMYQDDNNNGGGAEASYGLLRGDGSAKPAFGAYAAAAAALG